MKKITVYALRPDRATGYKTAVSNSLENLQRFVGGYIETVTLFNLYYRALPRAMSTAKAPKKEVTK